MLTFHLADRRRIRDKMTIIRSKIPPMSVIWKPELHRNTCDYNINQHAYIRADKSEFTFKHRVKLKLYSLFMNERTCWRKPIFEPF